MIVVKNLKFFLCWFLARSDVWLCIRVITKLPRRITSISILARCHLVFFCFRRCQPMILGQNFEISFIVQSHETLRAKYLNVVQPVFNVLSHFQFVQRFYLNNINCKKFYESMQRRLEKHLSSENNPPKKRSGGSKIR